MYRVLTFDPEAEWLEADGLGGFASGTVSGIRSRRYHALLLSATKPPSGRMVLVNGFDAWATTPSGDIAVSSQRYLPGIVSPDGASRLTGFENDPWPRWLYQLTPTLQLEHTLFVPFGAPAVCLSWRLVSEETRSVNLKVRLFFSGRDFHGNTHENHAFQFEPLQANNLLEWHPYAGVPIITALTNGSYSHRPLWYRNFLYAEEEARGLDCTEDLASPGVLSFEVGAAPAVIVLATGEALYGAKDPVGAMEKLADLERSRRSGFSDTLNVAGAAYIARRGEGKTVIAGFPWFGDWGRDTFIAMRGLCIAAGQLEVAREILLAWSDTVSQGMLPNRFPDGGEEPEFNSVDASLWYVIAVGDYLSAVASSVPDQTVERLRSAVAAILGGYAAGTRYGIRIDSDGLLVAGTAGQQLTWMDARANGREVTPRIGKPVEVQSLWLNALTVGSQISRRWDGALRTGLASFEKRFWFEEGGYLHDVVDCDHVAGAVDSSFRPNQIFAAGGLSVRLLSADKAWLVLDAVESRLLTPLGLRSLAPGEPNYSPRYEGNGPQRDAAYHQGTVWPWLIGPFVEAWVALRGRTDEAKLEARNRFLPPLFQHLRAAGLGHVSEIADAEFPHTPRGCPFQAWSLGELLRLHRSVLATTNPRKNSLTGERPSYA